MTINIVLVTSYNSCPAENYKQSQLVIDLSHVVSEKMDLSGNPGKCCYDDSLEESSAIPSSGCHLDFVRLYFLLMSHSLVKSC